MFQHLNVNVEVVALENDIEGEGLERTGKDGWATFLQDEETVQPTNLYNAIISLFKRNGDGFGHVTFNAVFSKDNHSPAKGYEFPARNYKESKKLNEEEKHFLDFFQKTALGDDIEDPLIKDLENYIAENVRF